MADVEADTLNEDWEFVASSPVKSASGVALTQRVMSTPLATDTRGSHHSPTHAVSMLTTCAISSRSESLRSSAKEEPRTLSGHVKRVTCVCLTFDKRFIVSGSDDCTVRVLF